MFDLLGDGELIDVISSSQRAEGLQVRVRSPRRRAGTSPVASVVADVPKVLWAIDFQFDSTVDSNAAKIASMTDKHTRLSVLNIVERSAGERAIAELATFFAAAGGPPKVLRMDNGPEFISQALQPFCQRKVGMV